MSAHNDAPPWFASWFDSPYYPILYQHRDYAEADAFVDELLRHLAPAPGSNFLDLACGRGRHSFRIFNSGFPVTGIDLSPASIADARQEGQGPAFHVGDMRDPYPGRYQYIFNLFTSFGYFSDPADNLKVLQNVRQSMEPKAIFVIDYLNAQYVQAHLVPAEQKKLNGIDFGIRRSIQGEEKIRHIVKDIEVRDGDQVYHFQERVQAITVDHFKDLFASAGLEVFDRWGDYSGRPFDPASSSRLIQFCRIREEAT